MGLIIAGEEMAREGKFTETLKVRIDPELLASTKKKAKDLHTDLSTYVRWCIRTGLFLDELNTFVRTKNVEDLL